MTDNNNFTTRPMLKKVKRPLNRMPKQPFMPQQTVSSQQTVSVKEQKSTALQNPFNTEKNVLQKQQSVSHEELNLDNILDNDILDTQNTKNINQPEFVQEYEPVDNKSSALPPYLTKNILILIAIVLLFVGVLCGKFLFTESKVVRNGLQGVVFNP